MEQERDTKEYAWKWVTASELLSPVACDLCFAFLTSLTAAATEISLYDGEDANGTLIVTIKALATPSREFFPHHDIYCRRGLYLENNAVATPGVFVMWRPRASKEG